jgi:hypothetical protein
LFLSPFWGLSVLVTGFVVAAIIDVWVFAPNNATTWFSGLRMILSIGTTSALFLTLAFGGKI